MGVPRNCIASVVRWSGDNMGTMRFALIKSMLIAMMISGSKHSISVTKDTDGP